MTVCGKTDIGRRRAENQDAFNFGRFAGGKAAWAVVCDGMGGAAGGAIASRTAVDAAGELFSQKLTDETTPDEAAVALKAAAVLANMRILNKAAADPGLTGMGTTYVAAAVYADTAVISHVGDSRCYFISKSGEITQVTKDHSYVQDLVDAGEITPEEARTHMYKNIITRAVGSEANVEADIDAIPIGPGDCLLLCSDGLSNMLSDREIADVAAKGPDAHPEEELVNRANANGGTDNITVVIIYN